MANEKEMNENEKVPLQTRVNSSLYNAICNMAVSDDRSISNTIERLLKESPKVKKILEAEPATAGANV